MLNIMYYTLFVNFDCIDYTYSKKKKEVIIYYYTFNLVEMELRMKEFNRDELDIKVEQLQIEIV